MVASYIGNHTQSSIKTAGTANISVVTTGSPVAIGNLLVAFIIFDNAGVASKPVVSSIAKAAGETNNWVFLGAARSTSTSSGAFSSGELWCIKATVSWPAASYLVTLDTSVTMKATIAGEFSGVEPTLRSTVGTAYQAVATSAVATSSGTAPQVGDVAIGFGFTSNTPNTPGPVGGAWTGSGASFGSSGGSGTTNNAGRYDYQIMTTTAHQSYTIVGQTAGNGSIVAILQATPGGPAEVGTATLSGSGTLTSTQKPGPTPTVPLSGSGSLSTTAVPRVVGATATLSGSGSLFSTQKPTAVTTASLSGDGTLTAVGAPGTVDVITSITSQLYIAGVPIGSPVTHTLSQLSSNVYAEFTVPGLTLAQLQSGTLTVRHIVTRANSTTPATVYVDSVELLADYQTVTPPGISAFTGTATLSGDGSLSTIQVPRPVITATFSGDGTLTISGKPGLIVGGAGATFTSLVLAGTPDGWWRHGEPSGTTMVDSSGNARSGVYTGSVVLGTAGLVAGDSDTALGLTGANTMYGTATYGSWQNRVTDIGFGQVFKTNVTTLQYMMQRWGVTAPDQLFGIDIGNTSGQVRAYLGMNGGSGNVILSTTGLNVLDGNKHFVFVTWRASDPTLRIYVDGVLAASVACTGTLRSTTDPIYIGRRVGVSTNFHNGVLDETIFGPALTDTQIADLSTAIFTGLIAGGVVLSGSGSLTTTQALAPAGVATLSGSGSLTTTQASRPVVSAALSGSGSLTTTQIVQTTTTATLSGAGTLSATGTASAGAAGVATLTGDGTLTTTQAPRPTGIVALSGAGTLSVVTLVTAIGTATLLGAGTLTTVQVPRPTGLAVLSGSGTLTTVQVPRPTGLATLSGDGTLSTVALPRITGVATLSGAGTLSAIGITAGVVLFIGNGTLSTTGQPAAVGIAVLAGSGTLTTTQVVRPTVIAVLSGNGTLTTLGIPKPTGAASLSGTGVLTVALVLGIARAVAFSGTGVLSAVGLPYEQVEFGWVFGLPFR